MLLPQQLDGSEVVGTRRFGGKAVTEPSRVLRCREVQGEQLRLYLQGIVVGWQHLAVASLERQG